MRVKSIVVLLCLLTVTGITSAQNRIGKGEVKELYDQHCASCHGFELEGAQSESFLDDEWIHGSSDAEITKVIRDGVPDTDMPPWKAVLSSQQIRSLVILIREYNLLDDQEELLERVLPKDGVFSSDKHAFSLEKVAEGTGLLWSIDFMPDGSILATQRDGKLWRFKNGKRYGPIADTPQVWQRGQGGLLEVALHPEYKKNQWIYLSYSESTGAKERAKPAGMTAIVRGRIKKDRWVDQEEIFHVPGEFHTSAGSHFGSRFVFQDGYLFFSIGDRGRMQMAQDISRPNGKVHRIHDDGRIPKDNPFVNMKDAYPSIWSYGNRNPQGLDKHPLTGRLWETEHGPRGGDEINLIEKGKNYGWPTITYGMNYNGKPLTEKTHAPGMEQPKLYWTPSIAVAGIDFYEGDRFPKWKHDLFVGGLASEELHRIEIVDARVVASEIVMKNQGRIRDVASGPDGYIYVVLNKGSPRKGEIQRLIPK